MKTASLFSLLALAALMVSPVVMMPAMAQDEAAAEVAAPRTGVRFVIVSPSGEALPSPLYYKQGKTFKAVRIGARVPSPRIKPEAGGVVRFWKEDPTAVAEGEGAEGASAGSRSNRRPVAVAAAKLPEPFMTVNVPANIGSKSLCILVPNAEGKAQSFFVDEADVPASGVHLINFSPYPLQMILSKKGDFSDKVTQNVAFFQRSEGITEKNRWSYKGENGEQVSFMLMYKTGKGKEYRRARASRFAVSNRQSQITVVVKDATRDAVKMLSIQLAESQPGN